MANSGIYKIQSVCKPDRIYIGSAVDFERRKRRHLNMLRQQKHHSIKMQRHYNMYGENDLRFTLIHSCSIRELIEAEQFFLDSHKAYFNTCKVAGSLSRLGIPHSIETKEKIRVNNKSSLPEVRLKKSLAAKGKKKSEEFKQKMRGRKVSDETRRRLSEAQKGKKRKSPDPKFKESMSKCHMKPILQYDMHMNFIREWESAKTAMAFISPGAKNTGITHCLRGRKKSYKGFIWRYSTTNNMNHENNNRTHRAA